MTNNLSYLHLWEMIIPNYNTLRKTISNHNLLWEIIIPTHKTIWQKKSLITIHWEKQSLIITHFGK